MTAPRRFAVTLLQAMVRYAPEEGRDWASAMLRELDFIEGDWAAVFWALGSTTAIFKHSSRHLLVRLRNQHMLKQVFMNLAQRRAVGLISGMAIVLVAAIAILALVHFSADFFSLGNPERLPSSVWVLIATVAEGGFVVTAIALWRKRRPMAIGILLSAVVIGTHVAMHLSAR